MEILDSLGDFLLKIRVVNSSTASNLTYLALRFIEAVGEVASLELAEEVARASRISRRFIAAIN